MLSSAPSLLVRAASVVGGFLAAPRPLGGSFLLIVVGLALRLACSPNRAGCLRALCNGILASGFCLALLRAALRLRRVARRGLIGSESTILELRRLLLGV